METKKNSKLLLIVIFIVTIIFSVLLGAGGLLVFFKFNPEYIKDTVTNITKSEKEVTVTDTGIADAVEKIYDEKMISVESAPHPKQRLYLKLNDINGIKQGMVMRSKHYEA